MKKKVVLSALLVCVTCGILVSPSVYAVKGHWESDWAWDGDGHSVVGTANASDDTGEFTLRVVRGGNKWIGYKNVRLKPNQSSEAGFWGQPFLDRRGEVLISPSYYHAPWFRA